MKKPLPFFLLGVAVFTYFNTFIWPHSPIYQGDNAPLFLAAAIRMSEGQTIYRDFFELTFPGIQLLYLALIKILGIRAWIPNAVLVVNGVALAWIGVLISRAIFKGALVFLPTLTYIVFAYVNALDATHHWLSILAVLAGVALVIRERTVERVRGAGALCGLATCFTQTRGPLALFALGVFLVWEYRAKRETRSWLFQRLAGSFLACLATTAPLVLYYAARVGFSRFVFSTVIYPLRYYAYFYRNNWGVYMTDLPEFSGWLQLPALAIWLFIHALVPLMYVVFFARALRVAKEHPEEPWDKLMLLTLVGLSLFLTIISAPTWLKISSASLPALIIFVWFVKSSASVQKFLRGVLWVSVLAAAVAEPALVQSECSGQLHTPTGPAAFLDDERYNKYRWIASRVHTGEFFFEAGDTDMYFLFHLRNPAAVAFLTPSDYTRPEQVKNVLESLGRERVRFVLWSSWLDLPDPHALSGDHLGSLRDYLRENYRVVKSFEDGDQLWERKDLARNVPPSTGASKKTG